MRERVALARCQEITKQEARNFYFGIRLLPVQKREALSALYALAREMDDIADGDQPQQERQANLNKLRKKVKALNTDNFGDDAALWGVYYAAQKYPIPLSALEDLLDGCEQDIAGTEYKTIEDTENYCRLVAGSVGRLSLGVFGAEGLDEITTGYKLADDLGVALQLTNILRDISEDLTMGRVYLPLEDLEEFGLEPDLSGSTTALINLIHFESERAFYWYKRGFELLNYLDRRSFACTAAMAGIYFNLLKRIRKNPELVLHKRVSLPNTEKAFIVGRSLLKLKP